MASPGNQSQDLGRAVSNALLLAPCSASPMKPLTTWRSTGSAPTSSRMAFANPATDRAMMCGSPELLTDLKAILEHRGFEEGNTSIPGDFVVERAFVEK